ncbi:MAG: hypothetical protein H5T78_16355 [Nocardia sp.]|nr:hypothetical protein [Nocardia sp.]
MTVLHALMALGRGQLIYGLREVDVYALPAVCDDSVTGVYLTGDVDQEYMLEQRPFLDSFVTGGGRVVVNGHVQRIFLDGLSRWRKLDFRNPRDLALTRVNEHPVWAGTDPKSFLYNTGTPGPVPFEELARIGVAGFYGRGWYADLPDDARLVHTLGTINAPIDYDYSLGAGRVLVHGGNDLLQFATAARGTQRLRTRLVRWLAGRDD